MELWKVIPANALVTVLATLPRNQGWFSSFLAASLCSSLHGLGLVLTSPVVSDSWVTQEQHPQPQEVQGLAMTHLQGGWEAASSPECILTRGDKKQAQLSKVLVVVALHL